MNGALHPLRNSSWPEQAQVYIYRQMQTSVMMTYITCLYDDLAMKHACGLVQEHKPLHFLVIIRNWEVKPDIL